MGVGYSGDLFDQLMRPFLFPHPPLSLVVYYTVSGRVRCIQYRRLCAFATLTSLSQCLFPGKLPHFIELMSFFGKVFTIAYYFSPYFCSADHNIHACWVNLRTVAATTTTIIPEVHTIYGHDVRLSGGLSPWCDPLLTFVPLCDHKRDWHLIGLWLTYCVTVVSSVARIKR